MNILWYVAILLSLFLMGCGTIPENFYQETRSSMPLEKKYTALGSYQINSKTFSSGQKRFGTFKVWYPRDLVNENRAYPVVVFANGTGVPYHRYEAVFAHLASWGFVVIGNDDGNSWDGASTSQSLEFLQQQNQNPDSPFYRRLNLDRVGVSGHSQGGVGAINAVSNFTNSANFKSVYTASTTKHALALGLKWPYDVAQVKVAYFMNAGTGVFDGGDGKNPESGIAPLQSLKENYDKVSGNGLTVMARRTQVDHGEMLYRPNGYMVAWFLCTLMSNGEAASIFAGKNPEILRNTQNWQDVKIKQSPYH